MALELLVPTVAAVPVALPGCPEACGSVTVPYPFGFRPGCFHKGFNLTCDETRHPPKLFLSDDVEVDAISLANSTVRVQSKMVKNINGSWSAGVKDGSVLAMSPEHNFFVVIGCDLIASLIDGPQNASYVSVSATRCDNSSAPDLSDTSCSGVGCCRTTIAWGLPTYEVQVKDLDQQVDDTTPTYGGAFIVDREWFSGTNVGAMQNSTFAHTKVTKVPTVLQWWLDLERDYGLVVSDFSSPSGWRCISLNSFAFIVAVSAGSGAPPSYPVRCNCSDGYEGNPYILHGCQDIDECKQPVHPCMHGRCINMPGTYRCSAIISLPGLITVISITVGLALLSSLLGVAKISNKLKQRRAKKLRHKFFMRNHGLLLQQSISSSKDIAERTRIFCLEELEQSTNNFDQNRILGGGGHGTVYKGILSDQHIVAIKKAKIVVQREINQFINEVVILSQTNHRNVVKLFGCCLETEVPLLVYEFISNGTLSFHLHGQTENPLSWKDRLRIALETARAIAYLHSAATISVYHRDIKSANILLTDTLTSKLSDFGASRSIELDETGILTAVQGTYGYLDPEYYYTGRLTEKSDVYSFGVILAELLTRVTPVFSSHSSEGTSLASHVVSLIRDNRFLDILDGQIVEEGGTEDAEVVSRLVEACLSLKGEERPTMRQVETILQDVQSSKAHYNGQTISVNQSALKGQPWNKNKGGEGTRIYSMENEFIQSSEIPR
ncbi:hypothetical protein CFC21_026794 [Triticum aestivum]|uniref:Protein kinase domain-containing protein n=2 Tax=Triticum aestivum TaxID=4565 RepID=A0A3B6CHF5_WHEAT|nr:wall-associated receptor kinase-like 8 [Triticum aestivum]KAF7012619.1 hypothetical protein CFC21_026794 [Triticum aestivum]